MITALLFVGTGKDALKRQLKLSFGVTSSFDLWNGVYCGPIHRLDGFIRTIPLEYSFPFNFTMKMSTEAYLLAEVDAEFSRSITFVVNFIGLHGNREIFFNFCQEAFIN